MATSIFVGINLHNKQLQATYPEFVEFANAAVEAEGYWIEREAAEALATTALTKQLVEFVKSNPNLGFYVEATTEGAQVCVVWSPSHEYYNASETGAAAILNTLELADTLNWMKRKMEDEYCELYSALEQAIGVYMLHVS